MDYTTIEEAAKCSVCGKVGEVIISQPTYDANGLEIDVAVYGCPETLCLQSGKRWVVQSDNQGNVPIRNHGPRGLDKDFPEMTAGSLHNARAKVEDILQREYETGETNES